ncbi:reverse transcriptase domain-containing protein [Tanacetum coccineum]
MKNVADLIINGTWAWPPLRTDKAPKLEQLVVPNIVDSKDVLQLRGANGVLSRFSVAKVWEAIRPRGTHVDWFRIIWFSHAIPRHSFNLWLIMRNSLKTQDRMRQWDVGNDVDLNLLRCALCESQQDSHTH